jgi:competence protein ComFB
MQGEKMKPIFHNIVEDKVIARVDEIFKTVEEGGSKEKYCTCNQCRMDTICYALNRLRPQYIVSHRGASRSNWEGSERQQQIADITTVIYEGLKRVNHNQRPNFSHKVKDGEVIHDQMQPVFNVPTIMGRLFSGENFGPIHNAIVELLWNNELVAMKDGNWQNPYQLVPNAEGNFSFWPDPAVASKIGNHRSFEYTLRITAPGFETLEHFFKIPVVSEIQAEVSFTLDRTFKLPDLYLFLPGEAEKNDNQD